MQFAGRISSVAVLAIAACTAQATTIVSFSGDYVTSNTALTNTGGYDPVSKTFSTISPTSGSVYSGPAFAGELSQAGAGNTTSIQNNGTSDYLLIKLPNANTGAAVVLFNQSVFSNGGNAQEVSFDAQSSISIGLAGDIARDNYLIIKAGDAYYISGDIIAGSGTVASPTVLSFSPTAVTWYLYDPENYGTPGTTVATDLVQNGIIADIQAAGIMSRKTTADVADAFRFTSFTVDATVAAVPEATSLTLLGSAGALMLLRRHGR